MALCSGSLLHSPSHRPQSPSLNSVTILLQSSSHGHRATPSLASAGDPCLPLYTGSLCSHVPHMVVSWVQTNIYFTHCAHSTSVLLTTTHSKTSSAASATPEPHSAIFCSLESMNQFWSNNPVKFSTIK